MPSMMQCDSVPTLQPCMQTHWQPLSHKHFQRSSQSRHTGGAGGRTSCGSLRAAWKKKPEQMAFWIFT